jgi:hypothetical protein
MDVVNDNSDGWAYWKAGSGAAGKLMDALQALRDSQRYGGAAPFSRGRWPRSSPALRSMTAPTLDDVQHNLGI